MEEMQATVNSLQATLDSLRAVLSEKDSELAENRAEIVEKNAELAKKDAELAKSDADLCRTRAEFFAFKKALSKANRWALRDAILAEDVEKINEILDRGLYLLLDETVPFWEDEGYFGVRIAPLSLACRDNKPKSVEALLAKGANNVDAENDDGSTALHWAVRDCRAAVPMLLAKGASVEAANEIGGRPLHLAAAVEAAQALVQAGADLNARNDQGKTPLMTACKDGNADATQFFLDQPGTDVSARDGQGRSVIHHAATSNSEKVMEAVLAHPAVDITAVDDEGNTALHGIGIGTCGGFLPENLAKLLARHFDIHVKNNAGRTPLAELAETTRRSFFDTEMAVVFLEAGAEVESSFEGQFLDRMRSFLVQLYRKPTAPLPLYRRTLRWAMTSPVVEAVYSCGGCCCSPSISRRR